MSLNQTLATKMLGALELANPVTLTSASGVLSLTADSNSFVAEGSEAITGISGGAEVTQGIYVITWNTARTLTYNAASLRLIGKADRTTAIGDVGVYQIEGPVTTELSYMPAAGYAAAAHGHDVASETGDGFMSAEDKVKLDGIEAGAQVNQEAFSYVKVGDTTIAAAAEKDTIELAAGANIALAADAASKKVTIAVDGKVLSAVTADTAGSVAWDDITGKPSTFPPPVATAVTLGGIKQGSGLTIAADGTASVNVAAVVPRGIITMWSGALGTIPSGWVLCDGANGTPDLRNRFIVGAGLAYGVGETGGEGMHVLTVAEMPAHSHSVANGTFGVFTTTLGASSIYNTLSVYWNGSAADAPLVGNGYPANCGDSSVAGYSNAHENRPPYFALAYIMKL